MFPQGAAIHGKHVEDASGSPRQSESWAKCDKKLRKHDYGMVKAWKEDIDTLLVLVRVATSFCPTVYS